MFALQCVRSPKRPAECVNIVDFSPVGIIFQLFTTPHSSMAAALAERGCKSSEYNPVLIMHTRTHTHT